MATSLVDYCEQTNPRVLEELNRERPNMPNARRVHESFLAQPEKRFMIWIAERLPRWVNSDHLTVLGFLAQIMAGLSYALARWNQYGLLGVIVFLVLTMVLGTVFLGIKFFEYHSKFVEHLVPGSAFGQSGVGYVRASYATAYEKIEQALERIQRFMRRHG